MANNSNSYYAVAIGRISGIYTDWSGAQSQTDGFPNACHADFQTLEESVAFMMAKDEHTEANIKVFGVRNGQYTLRDWRRRQRNAEDDTLNETSRDKQLHANEHTPAEKLIVNLTTPEHQTTNNQDCHTCNRVMTNVLSTLSKLNTKIDSMDNRESRLISLLEAKNKDYEDMSKTCSELRSKVNELTLKVQECAWTSFRNPDAKKDKSLLLGSSIIRDVKEDKLIDTKVISKGGARISNLTYVIDSLPEDDRYERALIVTGGNDCDSTKPADVIIQDFKTLGEKMKAKCASLTVSSVCPRTTSRVADDIGNKITSVNAGLQSLCLDEGWTYVNNDPSFHLGDGSVNDGYLLGDGVHLTRRATNKLAQNLKLNIRDVKTGVCGTQHRNTYQCNSEKVKKHIPDTNFDNLNIDHAFWDTARRKASTHTPRTQTTQAPRQHKQHECVRDKHHQRYDAPSRFSDHHTTCYNCGEDNHNQRRCRYSYRLQCMTCGQEGHKSKHHTHETNE